MEALAAIERLRHLYATDVASVLLQMAAGKP